MPRKKSGSRPRVTRVVVRAERQAEPDWDRFAWALLQHVKRQSAGSAPVSSKQRKQP
jgi:hypothetical protein